MYICICIALLPHRVLWLLDVTYNIITAQLLASGHHSAWPSNSHCHSLQFPHRLASWQQMISSPSFLSRVAAAHFLLFTSPQSAAAAAAANILYALHFNEFVLSRTIYISEGKYVGNSEAWDRNRQVQWTYRPHAAWIKLLYIMLSIEAQFDGSVNATRPVFLMFCFTFEAILRVPVVLNNPYIIFQCLRFLHIFMRNLSTKTSLWLQMP